jgi:hypothetical protein
MAGPDPMIAETIAQLAAEDAGVAAHARAALEWLTAGEGVAVLTQERLQYFLWHELPMKWPAGSDHHRDVAAALAHAFDLLDLSRYAAICRSTVTAGVLDAYERSDTQGKAAYRKADLASGISPPDLPEFEWGSLMGGEEAHVLSSTAEMLELAIAAGDFFPGRPGWKTCQQEIVRAYLALPRLELHGRTYAEVVRAERMGSWLEGLGRSRARHRILERVADRLGNPAQLPPGTDDPIPPLRWLLEQLAGGQALTQTGNLSRAFVQDAATRFGWWEPSLFNPPRSEDELYDLRQTHRLAERLRVLRRSGRTLTLTARGRSLLADPEALWREAARAIIPVHPFGRAIGEVALAVLAVEETIADTELDATVAQVIDEEGWRDQQTGEPADRTAISVARHGTTNLLRAVNLSTASGPWSNRTVALTEVGRATALEALHSRATGPASHPIG